MLIARQVLNRVGDSQLGEWTERGTLAFHLRRRLAKHEEAIIGPAVDLRGTDEAKQRLAAIVDRIPAAAVSMAHVEIGEKVIRLAAKSHPETGIP